MADDGDYLHGVQAAQCRNGSMRELMNHLKLLPLVFEIGMQIQASLSKQSVAHSLLSKLRHFGAFRGDVALISDGYETNETFRDGAQDRTVA